MLIYPLSWIDAAQRRRAFVSDKPPSLTAASAYKTDLRSDDRARGQKGGGTVCSWTRVAGVKDMCSRARRRWPVSRLSSGSLPVSAGGAGARS